MELKRVLALSIGLFSISRAQNPPCNAAASVDLTNERQFENNSILFEGVEYLEHQWYEDVLEDNSTVRRGCICLIKQCLFKCCREGQAHWGRPCGPSNDTRVNPFAPAVHEYLSPLEDFEARDHFLFLYGNPCVGDRYILNPTKQTADRFYLQKDGVLYQPGAESSAQHHPAASFCMDLFEKDPRNASAPWEPLILAAVCFGEETAVDQAFYSAYAVGLLISVPFLLATLLVYGFLPELHNLHGRCLMAYVSGLLVSFTLLAYLQLSANTIKGSMDSCYVIAFIVFYFFMSSFFWLNVMCFDIWRTFSRYGGKSTNPRRERRRFVWYAVYAWGMSLLLTGVTALMQFHDAIPDHHIKPHFGVNKCWFSDRKSELVYFYAPIFVLVVVNSVLFGVTARSIMRIRSETAILKNSESARTDQYERDKQRYTLYLKLFIVMGVNWILEVVSFFVKGSDWVWIVADLTNCALGIFIFVIFVWKNKVRNLIVKRYRRLRYGKRAQTTDRASTTFATRDSTAHTDTRIHSGDTHTDEHRLRVRER